MRCFVMVLLFSACCFGQTLDGSAWRGYSEQFKGGYVTGYVDAMGSAQAGSVGTCMWIDDPKGRNAEASKACSANGRSFDFGSITVGQLLDGMNAFYKDFQNLNVPLRMAMRLVRDEIRGRTQEDVRKEIDAWRQCGAGDFSKCFPAANSDTK